MNQTTTALRPSDRKLAELRAAIAKRKDVQEAIKRAPSGMLSEVLGGFTRAVRDDPRLIKCNGQSILDSLFDAIDLGLVPGREGYFIAYKDRCQFQTGYRGILKLVLQAGATNPRIREVRQGDIFRVELGDEEKIVHQMSTVPDRDKGPITHVYASITLPNGEQAREVWTQQRIDEHKEQFSEAWKKAEREKTFDSPWHTSRLAMAQKTVLLALCKWLPQTTAMQKMMQMERKAEDDNTLDAAFTVVSQAAEVKQEEAPQKTPKEPPQQEQRDAPESTESGPEQSASNVLSDAARERLDGLMADLDHCDGIRECQERLETAISASESVDEELAAKALADQRIEEIHSTRGERSNKRKVKK